MMDKASELVGEGAAEPTDFSLLVGASMWAVRALLSPLLASSSVLKRLL